MCRNRTIQYGVDEQTGYMVSRVGSEVAVPVIDFDQMVPEDAFQIKAHLETFSIYDTTRMSIHWTRKLPIRLKNYHREYWGFKPLKGGEA